MVSSEVGNKLCFLASLPTDKFVVVLSTAGYLELEREEHYQNPRKARDNAPAPVFMTEESFHHTFYSGSGPEFEDMKKDQKRSQQMIRAWELAAQVNGTSRPDDLVYDVSNLGKTVQCSDVAFVLWALRTHQDIWAKGQSGKFKRGSGRSNSQDKVVYFDELSRCELHMDPKENPNWNKFLQWLNEHHRQTRDSITSLGRRKHEKIPRARPAHTNDPTCPLDPSYLDKI